MLYIIIFLALLLFIGYTFVKLRPKVAETFPKHWHKILLQKVRFYKRLDPNEQKRFQNRMMQFLSEVYIDTVGVKLTELDKILIAASAVIPVFAFKEWYYSTLSSVILYPDSFNEDFEFSKDKSGRKIAGVVGTGRLEKKMILSKKALHRGFQYHQDGRNTAVHEFVHLIDKMDEKIDGIPEVLMQNAVTIPWLKLVHEEMESINKDKSDIRSYGGTKQSEFFAVASEYFFEKPKHMKKKHPELYKMLSDCFNMKV